MPIVTGTIQPMRGSEILKRLERDEIEKFIENYVVQRWREAKEWDDWYALEYMCHGIALAHPDVNWTIAFTALSWVAAERKWETFGEGPNEYR